MILQSGPSYVLCTLLGFFLIAGNCREADWAKKEMLLRVREEKPREAKVSEEKIGNSVAQWEICTLEPTQHLPPS